MADNPKLAPRPPASKPAGLIPDNDALSAEDEAALDAAWARVKAEDASTSMPPEKSKKKGEQG